MFHVAQYSVSIQMTKSRPSVGPENQSKSIDFVTAEDDDDNIGYGSDDETVEEGVPKYMVQILNQRLNLENQTRSYTYFNHHFSNQSEIRMTYSSQLYPDDSQIQSFFKQLAEAVKIHKEFKLDINVRTHQENITYENTHTSVYSGELTPSGEFFLR